MGWMNDPIADSPSPTNANGDVSSFVQQYGPIADKISEKLGVSSDLILGKLGLETAWGKKVIPGTNNLGNIKDVSGRGVMATDNYSGSRDAYLKFEDPETFGAYYTDFIQRLYPNAVGAGADAKKFTSGLMTGKNGAYAEDPQYGTKIAGASQMVAKARGASQGGWMNDPTTQTEPVTVVQPKEEAPKEQPKATEAAPKRTVPEELVRQGGLTARYGLQGAEKAFTFPVRAVFEAVGAGAEMLGAKDTGQKIRSTLGMGGNAGRVVADAVNLPKPETKLEKFVGGASETVAGLGVGGAAQKVAENAPAVTQNAVKALLPTASTGKEAAAFTAIGGAMDVAPAETAAALALVTAGKAGYDKVKLNQAVNRIIENAGSDKLARTDAEIIKRMGDVADDPARFFGGKAPETLSAQTLNQAVTKSFLEPVRKVLNDIPKGQQPKNIKELRGALQNWKSLTDAERNALRGTPYGDAVADAIEKSLRSTALTAAQPAKGGALGMAARAGTNAIPAVISATTGIPVVVSGDIIRGIGNKLGGRATREDVSRKLLNPRTREAADVVLQRLGRDTETFSAARDLADRAVKSNAARIAAEQAAKTRDLATRAQTRNQVLQTSKMPLGGGFQELLPGGASGLNLASDDAVKALRVVSKLDKNSPVSQAAASILKSEPVKDPNAFYGVQNTIRRLSEEGKIPGVTTPMGQATSSGIRNPVSYAANVRTAEEAAKLARESAPNKALSQFANKVAGTKAPADKLRLVEERLAKATDPAEIDYLNNFVRPLTNFGKK